MQEKKDDESEQYDSRPSSFAMDRMSADRISMAGASHGGITGYRRHCVSRAGARLEVQLTFSESRLAETQSYSIEDPARIVLDFPGILERVRTKALSVIAGGRHQCACSRDK